MRGGWFNLLTVKQLNECKEVASSMGSRKGQLGEILNLQACENISWPTLFLPAKLASGLVGSMGGWQQKVSLA